MIKNFVFRILAILILLTGVSFARSWGYNDQPVDTTQVAASHILVRTAAEAVQIKKISTTAEVLKTMQGCIRFARQAEMVEL